jgi:hypothetical protein
MTRQRIGFTAMCAFLTSFAFFFADEHDDDGAPVYMLAAYAAL